MHEGAQRMVREKKEMHEASYKLAKPIIRTLLPGLFSLYWERFDPKKRYPYMPQFPPSETIRVGMWVTREIEGGFRMQMRAIITLPQPGRPDRYKQVREWYIGGPTEDNPNPTVANPNNAELVGQMVFSTETIWSDLTMQSLRNMHKKYRLYKEGDRDLEKHSRYASWRHSSTFLDTFNARYGRLLGGSGYANELHVARGPLTLAYYELLSAVHH